MSINYVNPPFLEDLAPSENIARTCLAFISPSRVVVYSCATRQSMRRVMEPRNVVAVCGTTGVGKSAFAVDLARSLRRGNTTDSNGQDVTASVLSDSTPNPTRAAFPTRRDGPTTTGPPVPIRGVVLSADSMQLYEGLEVITNKVTEGEMRGVEHWGVGGVGRSPRGDEASREYRTGRGDGVDPVKETTLHDDCGSIHDDDGERRMDGFSGVRVGEGSWEVGRWVTEAWRKVSHVFISLFVFCLSLPSLESRSTGAIDGIPRLAPFRNACRLDVDVVGSKSRCLCRGIMSCSAR
jgi:hypothetical protein